MDPTSAVTALRSYAHSPSGANFGNDFYPLMTSPLAAANPGSAPFPIGVSQLSGVPFNLQNPDPFVQTNLMPSATQMYASWSAPKGPTTNPQMFPQQPSQIPPMFPQGASSTISQYEIGPPPSFATVPWGSASWSG